MSNRIGFEFAIKEFPIKKTFDFLVSVKEDFNYARYGSKFNNNNVGVAFLNSTPINVNDNILIKDLTSSVPENSPRKLYERIFNTQIFTLDSAIFLITDVFKTTSLNEVLPMYYRHDLSAHSSISEIEILDANFDSISRDLYQYYDEEAVFGYSAKYVYTNLKSSYDSKLNSYTLYYIKFKDDTTGTFITNLLNPVQFYDKATFGVDNKTRAYTADVSGSTVTITVYFDSINFSPTPYPGLQRFSVKIVGDDRIRLVSPPELPSTEKWYFRINPGEFYKTLGVDVGKYYVPEYHRQLFSPVKPYKLLIDKQAKIISERILYLDPKPISNLAIEGFYIYIAIKDKFGDVIRALTNDPDADAYVSPSGNITNIFYERDAIQSIAEDDGFIRLNNNISLDSTIHVTYRYLERFHEYRDLSINPTINPRILNKKIVPYVIPEINSTLQKTIFHVLVDKDDNIVGASQDENFIRVVGIATGGSLDTLVDVSLADTDEYTGYELEILSGINASRKLEITSYAPVTKTITVGHNFISAIISGDDYRINKKFNNYSYVDPISAATFNYTGWMNKYIKPPYYCIILSNSYIIQTLSPNNLDISDIRVRGGGVIESEVENALRVQDEAQWYSDIGYWDGQPYPGMGAILVQLPRSILKEIGGSFSREQVKDIVSRHMADGSYPIIRYYDKATKITSFVPESNKITIGWLDVGASSYNIYIGGSADNLTLYKTVAGVILSLEVDNLTNDKIYYFKIESVIGGVPALPSRIVYGIPFNPSDSKPPAVYGVTKYGAGVYNK